MKKINLPSKIPTRPSTSVGVTTKTTELKPNDKPLNLKFHSQKYSNSSIALGTNPKEFDEFVSPAYNSPKDAESLCTLIDCGEAGDEKEVDQPVKTNKQTNKQDEVVEKKLTEPQPKFLLYKQSALDSVSVQKGRKNDRKYVPDYSSRTTSTNKAATRKYGTYTVRESKSTHQKKNDKKLIPLADELKSETELRLHKTESLMQMISEEIKRQLKNLDKEDESTSYLIQLLNDSPKMATFETRIGKLEGKFDALVHLLHELEVIKGPQLKIELEEYDLKKLNSKLSMHPSMKSSNTTSESYSDVKEIPSHTTESVETSSDVNIYQESYFSMQQKKTNLQAASEDTLKVNGMKPKGEPERLINKNIFYPNQFDLKKSVKPIARIV